MVRVRFVRAGWRIDDRSLCFVKFLETELRNDQVEEKHN